MTRNRFLLRILFWMLLALVCTAKPISTIIAALSVIPSLLFVIFVQVLVWTLGAAGVQSTSITTIVVWSGMLIIVTLAILYLPATYVFRYLTLANSAYRQGDMPESRRQGAKAVTILGIFACLAINFVIGLPNF